MRTQPSWVSATRTSSKCLAKAATTPPACGARARVRAWVCVRVRVRVCVRVRVRVRVHLRLRMCVCARVSEWVDVGPRTLLNVFECSGTFWNLLAWSSKTPDTPSQPPGRVSRASSGASCLGR